MGITYRKCIKETPGFTVGKVYEIRGYDVDIMTVLYSAINDMGITVNCDMSCFEHAGKERWGCS